MVQSNARAIWPLLLAAVLPACAIGEQASTANLTKGPTTEAVVTPLRPPAAGKAQLVVTRAASTAYSEVPATVKVNGTKVADLPSGGTSTVPILPGTTVVVVDAWSYPGDFKLELDAKVGETIAVAIGPREAGVGTSRLFGAIGGAVTASNGQITGVFDAKVVSRTAAATANAGSPPTVARKGAEPKTQPPAKAKAGGTAG